MFAGQSNSGPALFSTSGDGRSWAAFTRSSSHTTHNVPKKEEKGPPALYKPHQNRKNQPIGDEQAALLRSFIRQDKDFLDKLEETREDVTRQQHDAAQKVPLALIELDQARNSFKEVEQLHKSMLEAIEIIRASTTPNHSISVQSSPPNIVQHAQVTMLRDEILRRLSCDMTKVEIEHRNALDCLQVADGEYQAACGVVRCLEDESYRLSRRIISLQSDIKKRGPLLAPWFRTPQDVWEVIWSHFVAADGDPETTENDMPVPGYIRGSRAMIVSSVCHSWRVMAHSLPRLWRYIYIPLRNTDWVRTERRANYYLEKCQAVKPIVAVRWMTPFRLAVGASSGIRWGEGTTLARLTCSFSGSYQGVDTFLVTLPAPEELNLQQVARSFWGPLPNGSTVAIPAHFLNGIKYIHIDNVSTRIGGEFSRSNEVVLQGYQQVAGAAGDNGLPQWIVSSNISAVTMRLDIPCLLKTSPMTLSIDATTKIQFKHLQTLEITLEALTGFIKPGDAFASIISLVLINTKNSSETRWRQLTMINFAALSSIGLEPIKFSDLPGFTSFLVGHPRVTTLELRGAAVDDALFGSSDRYDQIRTLIPSRYRGDGRSILFFVRAAVMRRKSQNTDDKEGRGRLKAVSLQKLLFVECPNVGLDIRKEIDGLLDGSINESNAFIGAFLNPFFSLSGTSATSFGHATAAGTFGANGSSSSQTTFPF